MQLWPITFQEPKSGKTERFSVCYKKFFAGQGAEYYQKATSNMVRILEFIEENIEGPPQWICTSHENCVFYNRDLSSYGEEEQNQCVTLTLLPSYRNLRSGFEIMVSIDLGHQTSIAQIYFDNLEDTARMIGEIARREVTFAAIRK